MVKVKVTWLLIIEAVCLIDPGSLPGGLRSKKKKAHSLFFVVFFLLWDTMQYATFQVIHITIILYLPL